MHGGKSSSVERLPSRPHGCTSPVDCVTATVHGIPAREPGTTSGEANVDPAEANVDPADANVDPAETNVDPAEINIDPAVLTSKTAGEKGERTQGGGKGREGEGWMQPIATPCVPRLRPPVLLLLVPAGHTPA